MKVKVSSTVIYNPHSAILYASDVVDRVWRASTESHPILTGLQEEGHSEGSLHYGILGDTRCRAFDVRTSQLNSTEKAEIDAELKIRLAAGKEFDIVWERNHLHIEYQPH